MRCRKLKMKKASGQLLRLRNKFHTCERGGNFVCYPKWKLPRKLDKYSAKLTAKYLGPARLQHVFSPHVVFLMDEKGEALYKFHVGDLTAPSLKHYNNVLYLPRFNQENNTFINKSC
jgi:hypothetical protein